MIEIMAAYPDIGAIYHTPFYWLRFERLCIDLVALGGVFGIAVLMGRKCLGCENVFSGEGDEIWLNM